MKNKKVFALLAALCLCMTGVPLKSNALTIAQEIDGKGTLYYYSFPGASGEKTEEAEEEAVRQTDELFERQITKENLAYLEKFGVTFDMTEGLINDQGKKIRWLVDERPGDGGTLVYNSEEGAISLYTVRDENGAVTGVREATPEEIAGLEENWGNTQQEEIGQITIVEYDEESAVAAADTITGDMSGIIEQSTSVAFDSSSMTKEELEQEKKREEEYAKLGIGKEDGGWTWEGKRIFMLLDDDGSLCQWGNAGKKSERIYVHVCRDADGKATEAEVVSAKELLEAKALQDIKEE